MHKNGRDLGIFPQAPHTAQLQVDNMLGGLSEQHHVWPWCSDSFWELELLPHVNLQLPILCHCNQVNRSGPGSWCWLLCSPGEIVERLHWAEALALTYPAVDSIRNGLQDQVGMPSVVPLAQGFQTASKDMLQRSSLEGQWACWCPHIAPAENIGGTW